MAKRRIISEEAIWDVALNKLSVEAQALWWRFLARSDDYGILPGDFEQLKSFLNVPEKLKKNFSKYANEYISLGIAKLFTHEGRTYFVFKPKSFKHHQAFINNKRTKSEYLRLKDSEAAPILAQIEDFWEDSENSGDSEFSEKKDYTQQSASSAVVSNKLRVESRGSAEGDLGTLDILQTLGLPASKFVAKPKPPNPLDNTSETEFRLKVIEYWRSQCPGNVVPPHNETIIKELWKEFGTLQTVWALSQFKLGDHKDFKLVRQGLEGTFDFNYKAKQNFGKQQEERAGPAKFPKKPEPNYGAPSPPGTFKRLMQETESQLKPK